MRSVLRRDAWLVQFSTASSYPVPNWIRDQTHHPFGGLRPSRQRAAHSGQVLHPEGEVAPESHGEDETVPIAHWQKRPGSRKSSCLMDGGNTRTLVRFGVMPSCTLRSETLPEATRELNPNVYWTKGCPSVQEHPAESSDKVWVEVRRALRDGQLVVPDSFRAPFTTRGLKPWECDPSTQGVVPPWVCPISPTW